MGAHKLGRQRSPTRSPNRASVLPGDPSYALKMSAEPHLEVAFCAVRHKSVVLSDATVLLPRAQLYVC